MDKKKALENIVELASARVVRTAQGSERFDLPIGSIIRDLPEAPKGAKAVSTIRLKSLYSQYAAAKRAGNTKLAASALGSLRSALSIYAQGKTVAQVRSVLESFKAPAAKAEKPKKE